MKAVSEEEFDNLLCSLENDGVVLLEGGWICECGHENIVYAPCKRVIHPCSNCGILLDLWLWNTYLV
jgi:hypothetical protein